MADATMDDVVRRLTIHSAHYPDLRALLAAYQSVRSENIDLWTELELCRKMCRTGGTE